MNNLFIIICIFLSSTLFSSCISIQKFKNLASEKQLLESNLSTTKQALSDTKRQLNKLKDVSISSSEEMTDSIQDLQLQLEESLYALDAVQSAVVDCQNLLQENELKNKRQELKKPLLDLQKNISQQNKLLHVIKENIAALLVEFPEVITSSTLNNSELIITFDDNNLFSKSSSNLSSKGREALSKLADILKIYPSVYIDINGHSQQSTDNKENWKNSSRKTLSIIYTLIQKEVAPNKIRAVAYGEYAPLAEADNPNYKNMNNRTEIVLHYQNIQLLKSIPLN